MTHQRKRIRRYISDHPGAHFSALTRALDLAPGQVQYHLKHLRKGGDVVEERLYGRTHYYTPKFNDWERGAIAVLRRETAREILIHLLEQGNSSPDSVANELGIARSTLEWHLDHLVEQTLVEKRRDEYRHVTLSVSRPTATVCLLNEITPTLSDRMLDRFTRLVDSLLSE